MDNILTHTLSHTSRTRAVTLAAAANWHTVCRERPTATHSLSGAGRPRSARVVWQFEAHQTGRLAGGALAAAPVRLQQLLVPPPAGQVALVDGAQVRQLVPRPAVLLAGHLAANGAGQIKRVFGRDFHGELFGLTRHTSLIYSATQRSHRSACVIAEGTNLRQRKSELVS